jgi:hypothetical protein
MLGMKIFRHKILLALMLSFSFVVVHDFFVVDSQLSECKGISIKHLSELDEAKVHMHEAVHIIWSMNFEDRFVLFSEISSLKPLNPFFSITSNINPVLQRPPSV